MKKIIFFFCFTVIFATAYGQTDSTIQKDYTISNQIDTILKKKSIIQSDSSIIRTKKHSVLKSVLLSTFLPGLGQVYNKKYWKIPIIYAGLSGLGYGFFSNLNNYTKARAAYLSSVDSMPVTDVQYSNLTTSQIQTLKNGYKSTMDVFSIFAILWYSLNIVDAAVDGHMFNYDVSNDLSLELQPQIQQWNQHTYCALSIKLKFKNN